MKIKKGSTEPNTKNKAIKMKNDLVEMNNNYQEFKRDLYARPSAFQYTKNFAKDVVLSSWERIKFKPYVPRNETFNQTVKKNDLSEDDLKGIYKNYLTQTVIAIVCSLICLLSFSYLIFSKGITFTLLAPLVFFVFFGLSGAVYFHKAFQVKTRRYMTFKEYFKKGVFY